MCLNSHSAINLVIVLGRRNTCSSKVKTVKQFWMGKRAQVPFLSPITDRLCIEFSLLTFPIETVMLTSTVYNNN